MLNNNDLLKERIKYYSVCINETNERIQELRTNLKIINDKSQKNKNEDLDYDLIQKIHAQIEIGNNTLTYLHGKLNYDEQLYQKRSQKVEFKHNISSNSETESQLHSLINGNTHYAPFSEAELSWKIKDLENTLSLYTAKLMIDKSNCDDWDKEYLKNNEEIKNILQKHDIDRTESTMQTLNKLAIIKLNDKNLKNYLLLRKFWLLKMKNKSQEIFQLKKETETLRKEIAELKSYYKAEDTNLKQNIYHLQ